MPPLDAKTEQQQDGILSRIGPIKPTNLGRLKMSIFGESGTGKTRFACSFPKPLLLIGSEDGTASVVGTPGVDFIQLQMGDVCSDFGEITLALQEGLKSRCKGYEKKPYATVVLDTASSLRDLRISEILGWKAIPEQKGWGFASQDQWNQCAQNIKDMLRPLIDLPKFQACNVVIVAHEQVFLPSEGEKQRSVGAEHIQVKAGSALGKSTCNWLNKEMDYIAQTQIRDQFIIGRQPIDGIETESRTPTGKKEYVLRVGPHSVFYTKFRLPAGRTLTEEFIVDPSYQKIANLIAGK